MGYVHPYKLLFRRAAIAAAQFSGTLFADGAGAGWQIAYLPPPFTFERFEQAVQKAHDHYRLLQQSDESAQSHLFLRADYNLVKITVADILFIEGLDNYLKIQLADHKPVVVRMTMKALLDKLPARTFVRVHRSYIVPLSKIRSVRNRLITIANHEIPLGSRYEADFYAVFQK